MKIYVHNIDCSQRWKTTSWGNPYIWMHCTTVLCMCHEWKKNNLHLECDYMYIFNCVTIYSVIIWFIYHNFSKVILVNRGWIPQWMKPKEKRQSSLINNEVELVGIVRLTEKRAPFMPKNQPEKGSWFSRYII